MIVSGIAMKAISRDEEPDQGRELQREVREARDRVEREADHLAQRELRLPGGAGGALVGDGGLGEADPDRHAAQETGALRHRQQRVERAPVHQAEVARVHGQLELGQARHQPVEDVRGVELELGLPLAALAHGVDDVGALAPARDHVDDQLRRVLQVGVDHRDRVPAGVLQTGRDGRLVAEVARQRDELDPLVGLRELGQDLARGVLAAVVDDDELPVEGLEGRDHALVEGTRVALLVVHRRHDADQTRGPHRR